MSPLPRLPLVVVSVKYGLPSVLFSKAFSRPRNHEQAKPPLRINYNRQLAIGNRQCAIGNLQWNI